MPGRLRKGRRKLKTRNEKDRSRRLLSPLAQNRQRNWAAPVALRYALAVVFDDLL